MQIYSRNQRLQSFHRHLTQSDIDRARNVPIAEWLSAAGFDDRHKGKLYYSPFRDERTPSFAISSTKNLWFDHGEHVGGDIIALVMRLKSLSFAEAVIDLSGGDYTYTGTTYSHAAAETELHHRKNFVVKDITDSRLVRYAAERGISEAVLRRYCKQAEFDAKGPHGEFHSTVIAFPTDSGGFELRMGKKFKQGEGHKGIRVIAEDNDKNATYVVFEGFFNFLTYAEVMMAKGLTVPNAIVLNSAGMWQLGADYLRKNGITGRILLCLDNDKTGGEYTNKFLKEFPNAIDMRHIYEGYNDLNDMMAGNRLEASPSATGTVFHGDAEHASTASGAASAARVYTHPSVTSSNASPGLVSRLAETQENTGTPSPSADTVDRDGDGRQIEATGTASAAKDAMPVPSEFEAAENMPDRRDIYMHVAALGKYTITAYHDRIEAWLAGRGWMSFRTVIPFDYPKQLANKIVTLSAKGIDDTTLKNEIDDYIYQNSVIWTKSRLTNSKVNYSMTV